MYLRARYYLPGLGVFPSLDPVEEGNRYGYVGGDVVNAVDPSGECPENPAALDIFGWRCRYLAENLAARLGKAPGTSEYQKIMSLPYGDLEAITAISTLNDAAIIPMLIRQDPLTTVEVLNQWICQRGGLLAALTFVAKGVVERLPVIGWVFPPLRASRWLSQMLAAAKGLLTATELVRSAVETEEGISNTQRTSYRGLDGKKNKPVFSPSQFRFDEDGLSTFELSYLPGIKEFALPFTFLVALPIIPGSSGLVGNYPGCMSTYTPQYGQGHWSINCAGQPDPRVYISELAKNNPLPVILNPHYTH